MQAVRPRSVISKYAFDHMTTLPLHIVELIPRNYTVSSPPILFIIALHDSRVNIIIVKFVSLVLKFVTNRKEPCNLNI